MSLFFRRKKPPIDYATLIKDLQEGDSKVLRKHLAFHGSVNYPDGVDFMLSKMRRPKEDERILSLHQVISNGQFDLAIFNVPWNQGLPYLPVIVNRKSCEIYGIMLAFNEIDDRLTSRQKTEIGWLATIWIEFAIKAQLSG